MEGGAWEAIVHGVATSRTRLSDFTVTHFTFCVHYSSKRRDGERCQREIRNGKLETWKRQWQGQAGADKNTPGGHRCCQDLPRSVSFKPCLVEHVSIVSLSTQSQRSTGVQSRRELFTSGVSCQGRGPVVHFRSFSHVQTPSSALFFSVPTGMHSFSFHK